MNNANKFTSNINVSHTTFMFLYKAVLYFLFVSLCKIEHKTQCMLMFKNANNYFLFSEQTRVRNRFVCTVHYKSYIMNKEREGNTLHLLNNFYCSVLSNEEIKSFVRCNTENHLQDHYPNVDI